MPVSVSLTMLHYKRPDNVARLAKKFASWRLFDSITVVCPAGSVPLPKENLPKSVKVVSGYGNDLTCRFDAAIRQKSDFCVLTDDDFEFEPSWVHSALAHVRKGKATLVAGAGRTPHRRSKLWLYNYEYEGDDAVFGLPPLPSQTRKYPACIRFKAALFTTLL